MTNEYVKIKNEICNGRRDILFFPQELNMMSDEERFEIEELIIKCCINGVNSSYKYIPYIKKANPNKIVIADTFKKIPLESQLTIIYNLYIHNGKQEYLDFISKVAVQNVDAYYLLTDIYVYNKRKGMNTEYIYNKLKEIAELNSNNIEYVAMFKRKTGR